MSSLDKLKLVLVASLIGILVSMGVIVDALLLNSIKSKSQDESRYYLHSFKRITPYTFKNFSIERKGKKIPAEGIKVCYKLNPRVLEDYPPTAVVFFTKWAVDNYYPLFVLTDENNESTSAYISTPDYNSLDYEPHDLPAPRAIVVEIKNWEKGSAYNLSVLLLPRNPSENPEKYIQKIKSSMELFY